MSTLLEPGLPPYPIHRFTVAEYEELTRLGILNEDSNVELLKGWIVPKKPKDPPHDSRIDLLLYCLTRMLPTGWFVRVQNSVVTPDSVPEPDLAVVRGEPGSYDDDHLTGADVGLIIEVADATVRRDRRKANIYARAGVPQYWIVNLDERQVEVYSQLKGRGSRRVYAECQVLQGDAFCEIVLDGKTIGTLAVKDLLPPIQ
jgi:Uma2 family endonuclease